VTKLIQESADVSRGVKMGGLTREISDSRIDELTPRNNCWTLIELISYSGFPNASVNDTSPKPNHATGPFSSKVNENLTRFEHHQPQD